MERSATIFITSLCSTPLCFMAGAWSLWSRASGGDQGMADAYGGLFLGIGIAVVGFVVAGLMTYFLITRGYIRYIQLADLLMIIALAMAWYRYDDKQPYELEYAGQNAILDVEIRAARILMDGKSIDEAAGIRFAQTGLTYYQPERIREEGEFQILPWYTYLHRVKNWEVRVDLPNQETNFQMNLPRRPTQSTNWSDWVAPSPHPDCTTPDGVMIRYRFRLVPYGQDV